MGGTYPLVEVVTQEWRLDQPPEENANPVLSITIKTRIVKQ